MPGHEDVEQDDRELALEQVAQRLLARRRRRPTSAEILEHGADREQIALVVVDDQHARARSSGSLGARRVRRRVGHRLRPAYRLHAAHRLTLPPLRRPRRRPACAAARATRADPDPQQRQQQVDVDRLGDIVRGAGVEAFLPVALHRLGGDRDQRQVGERPDARGSAASSRSRPSPAS